MFLLRTDDREGSLEMARLYQIALLGLAFLATAQGQTAITLRTQARDIDFSGASATKPAKAGTSLPGTCSVGEQFFKTNALAGENLYGCTATNTWSLLGDGGGTGSAVDSVFGRTGAVSAQAGDYSASQVSSLATGNIAATNVQSAIAELDDEKLPKPSCSDGQILKWVGGEPVCSTDETGGMGSLPDTTGNEHKLLSNDGVNSDWRFVGPGLFIDSAQLGVDTAVIPTLGNANAFLGDNVFSQGLVASGPVSSVDFSGAKSTRPIQTGTTPPANCIAREELFLDTDDVSLLVCNASGNGWTALATAP